MNQKLEGGMELGELHKRCNDIYNLTNSAKLPSLQYQINMQALVLNDYLKSVKIPTDNLCSFCCKEKETVEHFYWHCEKVNDLWILAVAIIC